MMFSTRDFFSFLILSYLFNDNAANAMRNPYDRTNRIFAPTIAEVMQKVARMAG